MTRSAVDSCNKVAEFAECRLFAVGRTIVWQGKVEILVGNLGAKHAGFLLFNLVILSILCFNSFF